MVGRQGHVGRLGAAGHREVRDQRHRGRRPQHVGIGPRFRVGYGALRGDALEGHVHIDVHGLAGRGRRGDARERLEHVAPDRLHVYVGRERPGRVFAESVVDAAVDVVGARKRRDRGSHHDVAARLRRRGLQRHVTDFHEGGRLRGRGRIEDQVMVTGAVVADLANAHVGGLVVIDPHLVHAERLNLRVGKGGDRYVPRHAVIRAVDVKDNRVGVQVVPGRHGKDTHAAVQQGRVQGGRARSLAVQVEPCITPVDQPVGEAPVVERRVGKHVGGRPSQVEIAGHGRRVLGPVVRLRARRLSVELDLDVVLDRAAGRGLGRNAGRCGDEAVTGGREHVDRAERRTAVGAVVQRGVDIMGAGLRHDRDVDIDRRLDVRLGRVQHNVGQLDVGRGKRHLDGVHQQEREVDVVVENLEHAQVHLLVDVHLHVEGHVRIDRTVGHAGELHPVRAVCRRLDGQHLPGRPHAPGYVGKRTDAVGEQGRGDVGIAGQAGVPVQVGHRTVERLRPGRRRRQAGTAALDQHVVGCPALVGLLFEPEADSFRPSHIEVLPVVVGERHTRRQACGNREEPPF